MEDYLLFMDNVSTPNFTSINTMFCLWQENMYWHARTRATVKVWLHHVREPLVWESSNDREQERENCVLLWQLRYREKKHKQRECLYGDPYRKHCKQKKKSVDAATRTTGIQWGYFIHNNRVVDFECNEEIKFYFSNLLLSTNITSAWLCDLMNQEITLCNDCDRVTTTNEDTDEWIESFWFIQTRFFCSSMQEMRIFQIGCLIDERLNVLGH